MPSTLFAVLLAITSATASVVSERDEFDSFLVQELSNLVKKFPQKKFASDFDLQSIDGSGELSEDPLLSSPPSTSPDSPLPVSDEPSTSVAFEPTSEIPATPKTEETPETEGKPIAESTVASETISSALSETSTAASGNLESSSTIAADLVPLSTDATTNSTVQTIPAELTTISAESSTSSPEQALPQSTSQTESQATTNVTTPQVETSMVAVTEPTKLADIPATKEVTTESVPSTTTVSRTTTNSVLSCEPNKFCYKDAECGKGKKCLGSQLGRCNCNACVNFLKCADDQHCGGLRGACVDGTCKCGQLLSSTKLSLHIEVLTSFCGQKKCRHDSDDCFGLPCSVGRCSCD